MRSKIIGVWVMWLFVMAVLVAAAWALVKFPLPGGSSGTLTLDDIRDFSAHIGAGGTIKILAFIFLPPIVLTYIEIWKARRNRSLDRGGL